MNMMSMIANGRCDALIDGLKAEFGGMLAKQILEAEAADFLWEARLQERYLGEQIEELVEDDDARECLSRIAVLGILNGDWHAAVCLVNGEGAAVDLLWRRQFPTYEEAEFAFRHAR